MDNPDLREMIDLATAGRVLDWSATGLVALAVLALAVGLVQRAARPSSSAPGTWLRGAAALAPLGLLLAAGWDIYLWRVRFDPQTGFCGLHKVNVLLGNTLGAVVLGLLYGLYLRWLGGLPFGAPQAKQLPSEED